MDVRVGNKRCFNILIRHSPKLLILITAGNDLRVEFKAVGDTVNLVSRVEGQAQPGTTYITEDTFKLTEGLFRFEGLPHPKSFLRLPRFTCPISSKCMYSETSRTFYYLLVNN